jgi:hypothetical protein
VHSARPALAHDPSTVGPAHEPFQPAGAARCARVVTTHNVRGGVLAGGAAAVGQWQGLPLEHEGGSGVAPSKERWPETNLRCVSTAGQRTTAA